MSARLRDWFSFVTGACSCCFSCSFSLKHGLLVVVDAAEVADGARAANATDDREDSREAGAVACISADDCGGDDARAPLATVEKG